MTTRKEISGMHIAVSERGVPEPVSRCFAVGAGFVVPRDSRKTPHVRDGPHRHYTLTFTSISLVLLAFP